MRTTLSVATSLALACLAAATAVPALAQTTHIHSVQVQEDLDRAEALLTRAIALEKSPVRKDWVKAAKLRVESADLRGCSDPEVFPSLYRAAKVFYEDGKIGEARDAFDRAASHALHTGDVMNAADAYIALAWIARDRGEAELQHSYLAKAQDLSCSPLLTAEQVAVIHERINDKVNGGGS